MEGMYFSVFLLVLRSRKRLAIFGSSNDVKFLCILKAQYYKVEAELKLPERERIKVLAFQIELEMIKQKSCVDGGVWNKSAEDSTAHVEPTRKHSTEIFHSKPNHTVFHM
ncbi:unnamed protein product [Hymenolepis diminuta]|uniref:Ovule protein n=1 Tax=Hymenolepis diminuta TaxID=6216 RepID=A0A0R3SYI7_HYMDI|nr:unnamed protein product [Hymenolepis diminuta]